MAGLELRPHHLLCLHFFQGYGYSPGFTAHMAGLWEKLRRCPDILVTLVPGPDPLCAHCPNLQGPECGSGKPERYDRSVLRLCSLSPGVTMPYRTLSALVEEHILRPGRLGEVCGDCEWKEKCAEASRTAG